MDFKKVFKKMSLSRDKSKSSEGSSSEEGFGDGSESVNFYENIQRNSIGGNKILLEKHLKAVGIMFKPQLFMDMAFKDQQSVYDTHLNRLPDKKKEKLPGFITILQLTSNLNPYPKRSPVAQGIRRRTKRGRSTKGKRRGRKTRRTKRSKRRRTKGKRSSMRSSKKH